MPGGTEKSHENLQPRQVVTVLRHEPRISRIRSKEVHHSTAKIAEYGSKYRFTFITFSDWPHKSSRMGQRLQGHL